jgi:hypothetical protein
MPEDLGNFDIAPPLMLAARTQMAQMTKRLAVKGFDGLTPCGPQKFSPLSGSLLLQAILMMQAAKNRGGNHAVTLG